MIANSLYDSVSSMFDSLPPNAVLDTFFRKKMKKSGRSTFPPNIRSFHSRFFFIYRSKKEKECCCAVVPGGYTFCASSLIILNFLKTIFDWPRIGFHILRLVRFPIFVFRPFHQ